MNPNNIVLGSSNLCSVSKADLIEYMEKYQNDLQRYVMWSGSRFITLSVEDSQKMQQYFHEKEKGCEVSCPFLNQT